MSLPITSIFAALLTGLFIYLSFRVIGQRRQQRVSLGDGQDPHLQSLSRAHGNFAEYIPFALLMLALAELQGAPALLLILLGIALLTGRILHAMAFLGQGMIMRFRVLGMVLTFLTLGATAALLLVLNLF